MFKCLLWTFRNLVIPPEFTAVSLSLTWALTLTPVRLHQEDQPKSTRAELQNWDRTAGDRGSVIKETTHRGKSTSWWIPSHNFKQWSPTIVLFLQVNTHVWTVLASCSFYTDASTPAAEQQWGLVTHLQMEHDSTFLKHLFWSVDDM